MGGNLRYSSEVKSLFKRLGVEPKVIELDQLGEHFVLDFLHFPHHFLCIIQLI